MSSIRCSFLLLGKVLLLSALLGTAVTASNHTLDGTLSYESNICPALLHREQSKCVPPVLVSNQLDEVPRLQKRSPNGPNAEKLMERADAERNENPGGVIPPYDPVRHRIVNEWADKAMQTFGNQQEIVTAMHSRIPEKIDNHSKKLKVLKNEYELDPTDILKESHIRAENRKISKWSRQLQALKADDNGALASEIADDYHRSRLYSIEEEARQRKLENEEWKKGRYWDSGNHSEYAYDNQQRRIKATNNWMKWRALANYKERGSSGGSTSYGR